MRTADAVSGRRAARLATRPQEWFDSPWRIAVRAVSWALIAIVLALVAGLVVIPRVLGGDALTILSRSMEPTFSPGDIVVVKGIDDADVCAEVSVGTIVSYFPAPNDPTLITHRVVGKTIGTYDDDTRCRLVTQGDANSAVDEPVSPRQVRGTFLYGVPALGWVRQWIGDNVTVVVVAAGIALVAWGLWGAGRRSRTSVVTVPREASGASTPPGEDAHGQDLRLRELALRERELALRERELEYRLGGAAERPRAARHRVAGTRRAPHAASDASAGRPTTREP
ncbi:signal peptidase I [Microbacterium hominis]|uniref:signal peptidase I n=1 Tax=Microbacterium hominis TaxID=162426 RepID=UPI00196476C1|nr:signal peptidase I [Microbacterium hominis]QRY40915.1 signal peptidase I [Microbacterium hominis]